MIKLIRQGFFCEMPHGEETDPSIKDYIGKAEYGRDKDKIIKYLQSGKVIINCCGTCNDILKPENGVAGVPSVYTDGKWAWPGDLWYYVDRYNLLLAQDFLDEMKKNNWENKVNITKTERFDIV